MEAWRSSASWWDANYGYRQQITVTAPASSIVPVGYPIKITIDTAALETATQVRSDRKDWRVLYFNGSSWVDLTRDYVSTTATFFGLQTAIAAGGSDSNYYVYYGYAAESTTKQASTEAEYNGIYGMFGTTPDSNSKMIFHFREGSGTTMNDDSTNSNVMTSFGTPTWATDGMLGRSLNFTDAGNNCLEITSSTDLDLGSMTLEGWFYFNDFSDVPLIGRRGTGGGVNQAWELSIASGSLRFYTVNEPNAGTTINYSTSNLTINTWYHIAATYDGSSAMKLYVNGVEVASGTNSFGLMTQTGVAYMFRDINDTSRTNPTFDGRVQHLRISNTARTSFPYALSQANQPTTTNGTQTTTQPPSSTFDLYAGGSDGKVYKWDGTTTWTEQFDTRRITWYETGTDTDKIVGDTGGTETAQGQSFQFTGALTIKGLEVYLKKNAGTPGDITVRIETNSTDKPSGTLANAAATATISSFSTTSYGWKTVEFDTAFSLSSATTYWIVLKTAAAANDTNYAWAADGSSPTYTSGTMAASTDGGTTWSAVSAADAYFRLNGNTTSINCMAVTSVGGTQKLYVGTGSQTGQTNGDARLISFDGTTWTLTKSFVTATESMILSMTEYTSNSKFYIAVGPQARVYETSDFSTFTLSKDINIPQNPGYPWAMKEYNRVLHVGGGSPEFLPAQFYNGFLNVYDTTAWNILYPFDFTVIKSLEFYDAYLFMGSYHGHLYVYDTATLNPLFNFKDQYAFRVEIKAMKYFDDRLYIALYPQESSNETNVGIWLFDRRGLSLAHTISGVTGYRCFTVVNGTLMVGTGDDGYVYKLNPNVYKTSGYYQSSYFDANLPSIDKLFNEVTIRHDPLAEGQSIVFYYKFKESDSWTTLGTSDTVGAIQDTFSFASGTYAKKITLKGELVTTDTTATPKLTEVVMQYALYPERKWQWTMRLKAKKNLYLLDQTLESRTATEIREDLENLLNTQQLYTFVDIDGTSYSVLVNDIDNTSWVVNQNDVSEDEVVINLLES